MFNALPAEPVGQLSVIIAAEVAPETPKIDPRHRPRARERVGEVENLLARNCIARAIYP